MKATTREMQPVCSIEEIVIMCLYVMGKSERHEKPLDAALK